MKKTREIIGGTCFFIFAAVYFIIAQSIPEFNDGFVSSDFMPKVYGIILMALSALQIFVGVTAAKKEEMAEEKTEEKRKYPIEPEVILTFVFLILYVAVLKSIGFVISTIVFLLLMITMFTPKERRSLWKTVLISVIFTVVVYLIFVKGLSLTLPDGILKNVL